jgi:hypothetical protein
MPYDTSRQFIATVTGLDLASTSTLARTTRAQGARARDLIAAEHAVIGPAVVPAATTDRPDVCYIVIDGTGAPRLPSECAVGLRVKRAHERRVPYLAVIGAREVDAGQVALRLRDGRRLAGVDVDALLTELNRVYAARAREQGFGAEI